MIGTGPETSTTASTTAGSKRALVIVGTLDLPRVCGALEAHGFEPLAAVDVDVVPDEPMALGVVDPRLLGAQPVPGLELLSLRLGDAPLVLLAGPCPRERLAGMIAVPTVAALVARDHVSSDEELRRALGSVARGPRFGWDDLIPAGAPCFERRVSGSPDRAPCLAELADFAGTHGVRRRMCVVLQDIADELITNAVYDAPVDGAGGRPFAALDRREVVELGETAHPLVRVAIGAGVAATSVEDPFGSLRLATARRYLVKGLGGGPDQLTAKPGGAGLGLTRVYELADRLTIKVEAGRRTEVVAVLEIGGARRDSASRPPSLVLAG